MTTTIDVVGGSIKDSTATGGATFIAYDSTSVSGNTGWMFKTVGVADLSASATLTADASVVTSAQNGTAALDANATTTAVGLGRVPALAATDASSTTTATALARSPGLADISSTATTTAVGLARVPDSAAIAASATTSAVGSDRAVGTTALSASATCTSSAHATTQAAAVLSAQATVSAAFSDIEGLPVAGPLTARVFRSQTIAAITQPSTAIEDSAVDVAVVSDVTIARLLSRPSVAALA
jgi:hypothetical protein